MLNNSCSNKVPNIFNQGVCVCVCVCKNVQDENEDKTEGTEGS